MLSAVIKLNFIILDADKKTPAKLTDLQNAVLRKYIEKHSGFFEALTENLTQQVNNIVNITKDNDNGINIGLNEQPSAQSTNSDREQD